MLVGEVLRDCVDIDIADALKLLLELLELLRIAGDGHHIEMVLGKDEGKLASDASRSVRDEDRLSPAIGRIGILALLLRKADGCGCSTSCQGDSCEQSLLLLHDASSQHLRPST